ncbi:SDR family oxidoreductase [Sphingomonas sp.]|uniref:SDR family oxidoreductase n=1 Tax=Sphingomonas sp. TaxID=28214 RepID=UPI003B3BB102
MTQTVLITGCSSGFGAATARLFADRGWNVVATMRDTTSGKDLAQCANILVTHLDVQDADSIAAAVALTQDRFGRLDALINNAGFGLSGVFEETPRAKIAEQFEVNLFGLMDVTRAVLPIMRRQRSGTIVNITSGAGVFGLPLISLYTASKFAVEGFSESLSYELETLGIRVRLVEPGGVTSTRFGERAGAEAAQAERIDDYAPFLAGAAKVFDAIRANRAGATMEEVAEVIYAATIDPSDRLRWVATDDIKPLVTARREAGEDRYMAMMRQQFRPTLPS